MSRPINVSNDRHDGASGRRQATLLGIIATCRAIGVSSLDYLVWAFDRLGTHRDVFGLKLEEMTPAAYKRAIDSS